MTWVKTLRAHGKDAFDYLQRQVSGDLRKLTSLNGILSTQMNRKGKMLAAFDVYLLEDDSLLIVCVGRALERLTEQLKKFVILEDVEFEPAGNLLSLQGPSASRVLSEALGQGIGLEDEWSTAPATVAGCSVQVFRRRRCGAGGWDLMVSPEDKEAVTACLEQCGAAPIHEGDAEAARIDAGVPRFGFDADERHLPPESGYDEAISYDKGCYVGQEIVARIRTYGHVNKVLRRIRFDGKRVPPRESAIRFEGKATGEVMSSAISPSDGLPVALGYVRLVAAEEGTPVSVSLEDGSTVKGVIEPLGGV